MTRRGSAVLVLAIALCAALLPGVSVAAGVESASPPAIAGQSGVERRERPAAREGEEPEQWEDDTAEDCSDEDCLAVTFVSVGAVRERDPSGAMLRGLRAGWLGFLPARAPPLTAFFGGEILAAGDRRLLRAELSALGIDFTPEALDFSLWLRPMAGLEYRNHEPERGLDVFAAFGVEFILRPTLKSQVAWSYDRIFKARGGTVDQIGFAFRWGYGP